mgnify:CR=1 FL=1
MRAVAPFPLRRSVSALLLAASVPLTLSACGSQEESSSSEQPVISSPAPSVTEAPGAGSAGTAETSSSPISTEEDDK